MRVLPTLATALLFTGTLLAATPAYAHGDGDRAARQRALLSADQNIPLIASTNVTLASSNPSSAGISGCFMRTKPCSCSPTSTRCGSTTSPSRPGPR